MCQVRFMDGKGTVAENSYIEDSAIDDRTLLDQTTEEFFETDIDRDDSVIEIQVPVLPRPAKMTTESRLYQIHHIF